MAVRSEPDAPAGNKKRRQPRVVRHPGDGEPERVESRLEKLESLALAQATELDELRRDILDLREKSASPTRGASPSEPPKTPDSAEEAAAEVPAEQVQVDTITSWWSAPAATTPVTREERDEIAAQVRREAEAAQSSARPSVEPKHKGHNVWWLVGGLVAAAALGFLIVLVATGTIRLG